MKFALGMPIVTTLPAFKAVLERLAAGRTYQTSRLRRFGTSRTYDVWKFGTDFLTAGVSPGPNPILYVRPYVRVGMKADLPLTKYRVHVIFPAQACAFRIKNFGSEVYQSWGIA